MVNIDDLRGRRMRFCVCARTISLPIDVDSATQQLVLIGIRWLSFPHCAHTESNWLNVVQYSLSTRAGTLVFAHETKIIVLTNKWDSRTRQFKYAITWSDELERFDDITAVLCLPIAADTDEVGEMLDFLDGWPLQTTWWPINANGLDEYSVCAWFFRI